MYPFPIVSCLLSIIEIYEMQYINNKKKKENEEEKSTETIF